MNSFTSLFLIFLSAGAFFFFTKPSLADLSALNAKKSDYEATLKKLSSIAEIEKSLIEKMNSLPEESRAKLGILLPDSPSMVKLVSDIDATAARHGISLDQISYLRSNNDAGASVATAVAPRTYQSTTLNFSFTADYDHLKGFLNDLEANLRLLDVRSIDINGGAKGVYDYKISAEVYSL